MEADELNKPEADVIEEASPPLSNNLTMAFLLALLALLVWHGFQAVQFLRERTQLSLAKESQDAAIQESQKIQSQFRAIMSKTAELAAKGHPGAKMIVEELQKRGVGAAPDADAKAAEKPAPKPAPQPDIKSLK